MCKILYLSEIQPKSYHSVSEVSFCVSAFPGTESVIRLDVDQNPRAIGITCMNASMDTCASNAAYSI